MEDLHLKKSEIARQIIKEHGLSTFIFPCCVGHSEHLLFKGRTNFENCSSVHDCEWLSIVKRFTGFLNESESKDFKLVLCPDKEPGKRNNAEPDAELINIQNDKQRLVIEVKSIHELDNGKNKDVKSFTEFSEILVHFLRKINTQLGEHPYALIMDEEVRWGKQNNQKLNNMLMVAENIQRIIKDGFKHSPACWEVFEVDGVGFCFMILDDESALENNASKGTIQIQGKVKRDVTMRPPKKLFDEYMTKILKQTNDSFESYLGDEIRKILLIVNESNYLSYCLLKELMNFKMLDNVELWFATPVLEEIDEFGNEEFYGEYEFTKVK